MENEWKSSEIERQTWGLLSKLFYYFQWKWSEYFLHLIPGLMLKKSWSYRYWLMPTLNLISEFTFKQHRAAQTPHSPFTRRVKQVSHYTLSVLWHRITAAPHQRTLAVLLWLVLGDERPEARPRCVPSPPLPSPCLSFGLSSTEGTCTPAPNSHPPTLPTSSVP